jgi:hypothetical protein
MVVTAIERAAYDEFLDVVLADPGLFEAAFAGVLESWQAGPPTAPPPTGLVVGRPGNGDSSSTVVIDESPGRLLARQTAPRPRVARSPPAAQR